MPEERSLHELYMLAGLIIIGLFALIIIRELKQKTKIIEVVRDDRGYIREVVERVV